MEICRFLVKLQAFCRILTKPEASAIFSQIPVRSRVCGQKPVFSILMEHFIHRCAYAAVQRKAHRGPLRSAILFLLL